MAPAGTVALIWVLDTTVKEAGVLLKVTLVAPFKPEPEIVNVVPAGPLAGEKPNTDGFTTKLAELVPIPAEFVTVMGPVVAAFGTLTVICVSEATEKYPAADAPLKATPVVPVKCVPVTVTEVAVVPLVGVKELMVGAAAPFTVKLPLLVAVKPLLVTLIGPVVAPLGTLVEI